MHGMIGSWKTSCNGLAYKKLSYKYLQINLYISIVNFTLCVRLYLLMLLYLPNWQRIAAEVYLTQTKKIFCALQLAVVVEEDNWPGSI